MSDTKQQGAMPDEYDEFDDNSECWNCGGEGYIEGDCTCMEDCCACLVPDPPRCSICQGKGVL